MEKKKNNILMEEIIIPEGMTAVLEDNALKIKNGTKEAVRVIEDPIKLSFEGNKLLIQLKKTKKANKRMFGSLKGHINNMIEGLKNNFEYELEICNVHFPMTLSYDKNKGEFTIKNLLGERSPRIIKAQNPEKIEVEIKAPHIKIKSYDLESAGQTAANLEKITRIRNRDRNKFQDGIFITKKPGRSFL